ncbi:hypothetical protein [Rheinheimera fenheensis]
MASPEPLIGLLLSNAGPVGRFLPTKPLREERVATYNGRSFAGVPYAIKP